MLGLEASVCSVSGVMPREPTDPLKGSPPPPFIDTRRDGYMYRGSRKSSCSPRAVGIQQSSTVGSTLWGMASSVVVVLGIVLDLAEIAPASCQPQQAAWSSL